MISDIEIVKCILKTDKGILIFKRADNDVLGGMWELVGGCIEDGENKKEACIRETYEEAGIKIDIRYLYSTNLEDSSCVGNYFNIHFFEANEIIDINNISIENNPDHSDYDIIPYDEIENAIKRNDIDTWTKDYLESLIF